MNNYNTYSYTNNFLIINKIFIKINYDELINKINISLTNNNINNINIYIFFSFSIIIHKFTLPYQPFL